MTRDDLATIVDNLDDYIETPEAVAKLKNLVLSLAVSGQLVPQDPSEGTSAELFREIQSKRENLVREGKMKKPKPLPPVDPDDVPFAIPESWVWVRLVEVGEIIGGGTPSSDKPEYFTDDYENSIAWLTPADLRNYKDIYISHGAKNITQLGLEKSSARLMPKNTVLFSSRAPIGHLAIAKNEISTNQGFKSIVPIREEMSLYIYRWLQYYAPTIDKNATGTTFKEVSGKQVEAQFIPLPPLAEQSRIVAKVDEIFTLIDKLARAHAAAETSRADFNVAALRALATDRSPLALDHLAETVRTRADVAALRRAILHLAVSGQLIPQDPREGTGAELFREIQSAREKLVRDGKIKKPKPLPPIAEDEVPFAIPESWEWVRLGDLFEITSSKRVMQSDWKSAGIPFLRARDLTRAIKTGKISSDIYVTHDYYEKMAATLGVPEPGDIMISGVGTIGTPYVVKNEDKFYFKDATILWFKNSVKNNVSYFEMIFHSPFMKKAIRNQSQGTTVATYTIANANSNIVPLPPLAEQRRIVAKTTDLLNLLTKLESQMEE